MVSCVCRRCNGDGERHHPLVKEELGYVEMIDGEQTDRAQYQRGPAKVFQVIRFPELAHPGERGAFNEPCDRNPWRMHTNRYRGHQESGSNRPMDISCR